MPNLSAMASEGAIIGAPRQPGGIRVSGSNLSLPGYVELFTGDVPTGCDANDCTPVARATIADAFARIPEHEIGDVAIFASWPSIGLAAGVDDAVFKSVGRALPPAIEQVWDDHGFVEAMHEASRSDPEPGFGGYRPDAHTAKIALDYLERREPRFLFIGLGDTDELAHHDDYAGYLRALGFADRVIGQVLRIQAERRSEGLPSTLFVTTDHGRGDNFTDHGPSYPESARIWLVAHGSGISARGAVGSESVVTLADVAPTLAEIAGIDWRSFSGKGEPIECLLRQEPSSTSRMARSKSSVR